MAMRTNARNQQGQALIELLIAALVMVPLFLALVGLGKFLSIQDAVIASSRWLAFECSVRPAPCELPGAEIGATVWARQFAALDSPVRSIDHSQSQNPLWVDQRNHAMIAGAPALHIEVSADRFDAGTGVVLSGRAARAGNEQRLAAAGPARFGLDAEGGLSRLSVAVDLERLFDSPWLTLPPLRFTARGATLADAWNASAAHGDEPWTVQSRVAAAHDPVQLDPGLAQAYQPALAWLSRLGQLGLEPQAARLRMRELDVDILPDDRVGATQ